MDIEIQPTQLGEWLPRLDRAFTVAGAYCPACKPELLGSAAFRRDHGVRYAYHAGAMANGIASEQLVIALGRAGILASFGAAGLLPPRVEQAIARIRDALPRGPYAFNLIHSPSEDAVERAHVELFLKHGVRTVEASAYLALTPHVVRYRLAGLSRRPDGSIAREHRVLAKVSRPEVARHFMMPAPARIIEQLLAQQLITREQAELAAHVPMADDITVEADSAGHTDNRPFITIVPTLVALRDSVQAAQRYAEPLRIGVGGGIGTPSACLAAFVLGADYIVTGSVNQACVQSGTSDAVRKMLADAEIADFAMAPAADMFEMGVKLQVLKRGTMFAMRAGRLYELYRKYEGVAALPRDERQKLEEQLFRCSLDEIWQRCVEYFAQRDPEQIARARQHEKRKLALIFRWYLGISSHWANSGEPGRELDYQIWAGPAIGAFNAWTHGTYLAEPKQRDVRDVAENLMTGAAYLSRVHTLRQQGVTMPEELASYKPQPQEQRSCMQS
ncbi:MAG TPA: PfaD family polyunsaturated fatty acid/polyketide biosynthesis protein [Polyangiales bacterium]|nr:PfaD family polyunsaturated fatty acid/polyketide biosynthesis protein [Polyangiales bacterium]